MHEVLNMEKYCRNGATSTATNICIPVANTLESTFTRGTASSYKMPVVGVMLLRETTSSVEAKLSDQLSLGKTHKLFIAIEPRFCG